MYRPVSARAWFRLAAAAFVVHRDEVLTLGAYKRG